MKTVSGLRTNGSALISHYPFRHFKLQLSFLTIVTVEMINYLMINDRSIVLHCFVPKMVHFLNVHLFVSSFLNGYISSLVGVVSDYYLARTSKPSSSHTNHNLKPPQWWNHNVFSYKQVVFLHMNLSFFRFIALLIHLFFFSLFLQHKNMVLQRRKHFL